MKPMQKTSVTHSPAEMHAFKLSIAQPFYHKNVFIKTHYKKKMIGFYVNCKEKNTSNY